MKLVVLPGNSKSNKEWSEKTADALLELFPDQYIQVYSHWDEGKELIDFDVEMRKLEENVKNTEFSIIAKSAGAMLAIYSISRGLIRPAKCVFFGLPLLWAEEYGFDLKNWIKDYNIPTLIIQNSNDPMALYSDVKKLIDDLSLTNTIRIVEIEGNDHKYANLENTKKDIEAFYLN